ncbi:hypothetical protein L207DRAFT_577279 [Hyaloscypha variabilis F]|uniref:Alpha box domain-containing protein n=1 Tax=Hyaloscypha variabilis (strain UAMH 11265 / GT02V1 / F) TaxID=1149755 RepID=A0A2J6S6N2_HYAVF|nr:hypothetical protein L207DRAFT_577279 [Hyaloscypha variabilis F]
MVSATIPPLNENVHFQSAPDSLMHGVSQSRTKGAPLETAPLPKFLSLPMQVQGQSSPQSDRHGKRLVQRSLNSFMAFRSFYKPIFPKLQQNNTFSLLTTRWENDPFKANGLYLQKHIQAFETQLGSKEHHFWRFGNLFAQRSVSSIRKTTSGR